MKYSIYTILIFAISIFIQCTPKTTETVVEDSLSQNLDKESWRATPPLAGKAKKIELGEYNEFMLDNGLEVIVVENHKIPRVSYSLSLKHKTILEGPQAGYVYMAGQLLGSGTSDKSKAELDEEIDFIGASLSTSGRGIYASGLTKHKTTVLDLMTEILYTATFPKEEFDKIKSRSLSGLETSKTDPGSMMVNVNAVVNYGPQHPYGEIQTIETTNNITLEKCKSYYEDYFVANNAFLVVVGDITMAEVKADCEKYFALWKSGEVQEKDYANLPKLEGRQVSMVNNEGAVQSNIRLTHTVNLKPGDPDVLAASLANSILGGGVFKGRLMQNLREDKAYTYGARSSLSANEVIGEFSAYADVRNEVTDSAITQFFVELKNISEQEITQNDLELVKNAAIGSFARSLESPRTLAGFAIRQSKYNLPDDYYATYLERLEKVTVNDVQAAAKKYINPDQINVIIVGNKEAVADKLIVFDQDGEIDYYDEFGRPVVESRTENLSDEDPSEILTNYLKKVQGDHASGALQSLVQDYTISMLGQEAHLKLLVKDRKKSALKVELQGMVVQDQRFDGERAIMGAADNRSILSEGVVFDQMKMQTNIYEQELYLDGNHSLSYKGTESIDGKSCHKIGISTPNGKEITELYDAKNYFLVRSVVTSANSDKPVRVDLKDYKLYDGYYFPQKVISQGAGPAPIAMTLKEILINPKLDDSLFEVKE